MDVSNIANVAWSAPLYGGPTPDDSTAGGANQAQAAAKAFDAMIFRMLLQSVNLFGTEQAGSPWSGLWQGVLADQWAQELATQHMMSFGAVLLNENEAEEGGLW